MSQADIQEDHSREQGLDTDVSEAADEASLDDDAEVQVSPSLAKALELFWALTEKAGTQLRVGDIYPWDREYSLKDAIRLDPTEITARMTVENMALNELDARAIPLRSLLEGDPETERQVDVARRLLAQLRSAELKEPIERFRQSIQAALQRYEALDEATLEVIDDVQQLAPIRLSALKNIARLKEFQFLRGAFDPAGVAPVYYEQVFLFWNVNSMFEAATRMRSGVMVALVKEPQAAFSYFVFCVRNGGNLYILTDRPDHPHPEFRNMTRKPERRLADRINAGFFPYDLLDYEIDEEGKIRFAKSKDLVVYQQQAVPMKAIRELEPEERVWIALMFDLIVYRYWNEKRQMPELCYTGEMVRTPTVLLDVAAARLPVVVEHNPLVEAPVLTVDDVKLRAMAADDFATPPVGHNQWMEDLYGHDMPTEVLNPVLDDSRSELRLSMAGDGTPRAHVVDVVKQRNSWDLSFVPPEGFEGDPKALKHLSIIRPDDFGTREQLLSDRRWVARRNFTQVIKARAIADFEANTKGVSEWFRKAVAANSRFLLERVAAGELIEDGVSRHSGFKRGLASVRQNMLTMHTKDGEAVRYTQCGVTLGSMTQADIAAGKTYGSGCAVTAQKASAQAQFHATTAHGISLLTGVAIEDLPKWLQHWTSVEPYTGNSILDRLDPLDSIDNPWHKMPFSVGILLSKTAMKPMGLRVVVVPEQTDPESSWKRIAARSYIARIGDPTDAPFPTPSERRSSIITIP